MVTEVTKSIKPTFIDNLAVFGSALLFLLAAVIMSALTLAAVGVTVVYRLEPSIITQEHFSFNTLYDGNLFTVFFIPLILAFLIVIFLILAIRVTRHMNILKLMVLLFISSLVIQLGWIFILDPTSPYPYIDSLELDNCARSILSSNFSGLLSTERSSIPYLIMYPFQSGSVLLFAACYALFRTGNQMPIMVLNALFNSLALLSLVASCHLLFKHSYITRICIALCLLCFPLFFSAPFVYGNSIGFGLASLAIACTIYALDQERCVRNRILSAVISCIALTISLTVKSTFVLILIAITFVWIVHSLYRRRYFLLPIAILCALFINQAPSIATKSIEAASSLSFGQGMPKTSWIAMGLREDNIIGTPGWWGFFPSDTFHATEGDYDAQQDIAIESISSSLSSFFSNPKYAASFFIKKLASEWLDPWYQSLYYSQLADSHTDASGLRQILYSGYSANRIATEFVDAYQTIVFLGALVGFCCLTRMTFKNVRNLESLIVLPLTFVCGFGCYVFWEAKGVYLLPFFVILLPISAFGLFKLYSRIHLTKKDYGLSN